MTNNTAKIININDYRTNNNANKQHKNRKIRLAIKRGVLYTITTAMIILLMYGIGAVQDGNFTQGYILSGISLTWLMLFFTVNADYFNAKIEASCTYDDDYDDYDDYDEY